MADRKRKWTKGEKRACVIFTVIIMCLIVCFLLSSHILFPMINGTLTLHGKGADKTYGFSDPGGRYGEYEWNVGTKEVPIRVELLSRNSHHRITMHFDVAETEAGWHITGKVDVEGREIELDPLLYDRLIPFSEPIRINVDCFP